MSHRSLLLEKRGLASSFGKAHVARYGKTACEYCDRRGRGETCDGCGAPLPDANDSAFVYQQDMLDAATLRRALGMPGTNIPLSYGHGRGTQ